MQTRRRGGTTQVPFDAGQRAAAVEQAKAKVDVLWCDFPEPLFSFVGMEIGFSRLRVLLPFLKHLSEVVPRSAQVAEIAGVVRACLGELRS
jgi:hypothetical protein